MLVFYMCVKLRTAFSEVSVGRCRPINCWKSKRSLSRTRVGIIFRKLHCVHDQRYSKDKDSFSEHEEKQLNKNQDFGIMKTDKQKTKTKTKAIKQNKKENKTSLKTTNTKTKQNKGKQQWKLHLFWTECTCLSVDHRVTFKTYNK